MFQVTKKSENGEVEFLVETVFEDVEALEFWFLDSMFWFNLLNDYTEFFCESEAVFRQVENDFKDWLEDHLEED